MAVALSAFAAHAFGLSDVVDSPRAGSRHAAQHHIAPTPWEQAEQGRDALEATPEGGRTRAAYARAADAYRAIYHSRPGDLHAPAAINAVAELLAEQGRIFHDAKSLQAAIGQYEFLRKQYPGSSLRMQALLTEGEIQQNDLEDPAAARALYKQLLKDYPKSEQADEARAGVASLDHELAAKGTGNRTQGTAGRAVERAAGPRVSEPAKQEIASTTPAPQPVSAVSGAELQDVDAQTRPADGSASNLVHHAQRMNGRALVTGVRHWSTSTYTRVAIDLGDNVTYEAARVPHPDRIYFDLHGARLAPGLAGKSFDVTDDGFLKRVRAAQYSDDTTRVVLDVSDVSDYSAFLLPNPYRLIIDIHGGRQTSDSASQQGSAKGTGNREQGTGAAAVAVSANNVPPPHTAPVVKTTLARPVSNAVATKNPDSANELAGLSGMPGRVEATRKPTSKPISAVVTDGEVAGDTDSTARTALPDTAVPAATPAPAANIPSTAPSNAPVATASRRTRRRGNSTATITGAIPARAAAPMADGETSLVRALGLKIGRIVIDAGHGGHDSGTIGADGIQEKDVVLDVALRLGTLLHDRLGAEIIYTRSDDTFIPLETRTAIANKAQADLFISVHANSSPDESARGVEVYYLNFTSDPTALDVAARENAVSDQSIHQLSDLVKKITLKDKISESREFASDVEGSLYSGLTRGNAGLKDRGVKKAPFVVLIGANMPSILAEISFVTNPKDASQLRDPDYRERVAESLYRGIARYESGLSGARPAPTERASVGN
ncbi:MAG TPA: N-acetylmuramoyl-L-alanine amidase [Acidobacteriaceae bacterium]